MYPELFHLGPITIYSFGLMMAAAFLTANFLFTKETKKRGYGDELPSTVTLIALIAGVAGSKLFHVIENPTDFLRNPIGSLVSGAGLTFFGGLLTAIFCIALYLRKKKIPFLDVADAVAPALILAYGIGRIGCQLAGDGDYGIPSTLPWAMGYPQGVVSTLSATNVELRNKFMEMYPGTPVPIDIAVHPTPVYETLLCLLFFFILMKMRKYASTQQTGWLFGLYLLFSGIERFPVEFIRLNPLYLGLSQAQWIAIGLAVAGLILMKLRSRKDATVAHA